MLWMDIFRTCGEARRWWWGQGRPLLLVCVFIASVLSPDFLRDARSATGWETKHHLWPEDQKLHPWADLSTAHMSVGISCPLKKGSLSGVQIRFLVLFFFFRTECTHHCDTVNSVLPLWIDNLQFFFILPSSTSGVVYRWHLIHNEAMQKHWISLLPHAGDTHHGSLHTGHPSMLLTDLVSAVSLSRCKLGSRWHSQWLTCLSPRCQPQSLSKRRSVNLMSPWDLWVLAYHNRELMACLFI